jgi:hypothetical protein
MTPTQVVAGQVRHLRHRRGWSASDLAAKMTDAGFPWDRSLVSRLETGARENVTLDEVLALAYVLNVAPVYLFVPSDPRVEYQVVPVCTVGVLTARQWVRGQQPLPGADRREYIAETPPEEYAGVAKRLLEELTRAADEVQAQGGGESAA